MSTKIPYSQSDDVSDEVELSEEAADYLADRVAAKMAKPARSELGDVPIKSGDTRAPIYGGYDKYVEAGLTDAEVATNLYIAKTILNTWNPVSRAYGIDSWTGEKLVSDRLNEVMVNAATKALQGDGTPIAATEIDAGFVKAMDPDGFVTKGYRAMRGEARTKAMTSTGVGSGDEWVPTFAAAELWRDTHLATEVAPAIPQVNMPTNPYTLPTQTADATFRYASAENTAITASNPTTSNATLTAKKIQAEIDFSGEFTEDSIVPAVPNLRRDLVRRGAQTIDDLVVHGDTETAGTGNVNSDDAAPAADAFYVSMNGLRKFAIVTNTGQTSNVAAALTAANFNTIRQLLGKYGARASDLRIVAGYTTVGQMLTIAEVITPDKYGAGATILRGELGRFYNIPILQSEAIAGATIDKVADDGKYTTTSPASNDTKGWLVLFNRNHWHVGFRREFQIESFRDIQKDQNILVASFRMALTPSGIGTTHTAAGRNVTI